jgi:hypothetical protein
MPRKPPTMMEKIFVGCVLLFALVAVAFTIWQVAKIFQIQAPG